MRTSVCIFAALLLCSRFLVAQHSDCASINRAGNEVILTAKSWRPLRAIGNTLADRYGIAVSVEDPKWAFPADTEDVADADPEYSSQHGNIHYQIMKSHVIQIRFPVFWTGYPTNVPDLLQQLVDAANREMPYAYRLDVRDNVYALVPTQTLNSAGKTEKVQPLLDHHVNIPAGTRSIAVHAELMADQLSQQTGFHIGCCQAIVAGIPWGMAKIFFEAHDKPAREILKDLIRLEDEANSESASKHASYDHWTVGCDGTGSPWCFVEVEAKFGSRCSGTFSGQ